MSRAVPKPDAFKAVITGIEDAQRAYDIWTGGDWLWNAPEYLITTHIAKKLGNLDEKLYITLESNVTAMLREAGAIHRGASSKKLRKNGRFDAVLWWASGAPRAAIEVKNWVWSFNKIKGDAERLIELLKKKQKTRSKFQFGAIAFYTSASGSSRTNAKDQLTNLDKNLFQQFSDLAHKHNLQTHNTPTKIHRVGESAWVAHCYVIY